MATDERIIDTDRVVDWLLGEATAATAETLVTELGPELVRAGVRVARFAAFVRTLHPFIMGRAFRWYRDQPGLSVVSAPYEFLSSPEYMNSPTGHVYVSGKESRWRLDDGAPLPYRVLEEQRAAGMTDYVALPLRFLSGEVNAITYSTDAPGGFSAAEIVALTRVTRALSRVAEILALRRTASNLLDAYVGHNAGSRILEGHVRRGETEIIRCVIWFSDLRGFTVLSATQDPPSTIQLLNQLFDCQVPAVERHGGEVLKFIGDGMLAIFRVPDPSKLGDVAKDALAAAREAFAALDVWNGERVPAGLEPLRVGLALHVGDVGYGNIGGAGRLDFTCIGAAVNLASRVEGLTGKLGKRLLLTEAMAQAGDTPTRCVGAHEVKGVTPAPVVYELVDGWSMLPSSL